MDYEREDKIALRRALLALGQCPVCRRDTRQVVESNGAYGVRAVSHVAGCVTCDRAWEIETGIER